MDATVWTIARKPLSDDLKYGRVHLRNSSLAVLKYGHSLFSIP